MSSTQPDLTEFSRQFSEEASRLPGGGGRGGEGGGICSRDVVVYCSGSGVECVAMEPWSTHEPSAPKGHERGHHHHHHHHQQRHHHQHQQSQEEEEEEDDVERETRAKPLGDEQIFSDVLSENPGFTFDSVGPCRLCCGCSCCPGRTEDDNKRCIFSGGLLPPTATHVDCFDLLNHGPPTPRPSMRDESMLACGAPSLKASQNLFFLNERSENLLLRLSLSLTLGSLLAALTFLWLHLMIPTLNFIWVSLVSFVVLVVSFAVMFNSLLVRCTAALVLPSIGTDGGRMALVLLLLGCLLSGPMAGINSNLRQMSVYYDCLRNHHHRNFGNYSDTASGITPSSSSSSSSSSLSSSPVFLQPSSPSSPFQYVIHPSGTITSSSSSPSRSRLNDSIVKLLMSTHRVMESLETLRGGLYSNKHNYHHYRSHIHSPHHQDNHHPYLYHHQRHHHNQHHNQDRQHAMGDKRDSTGFDQRREVYGFENTCSSLMKHAHDVCLESIREAKVQCLGVIDALGNVYHHAKDILDTINPDRWLTRQQILMKRQKYHQMSQQQQQYPQMRSKRDEQSEDDQWTIEKQRQIFQQGQQQNFTQHQQQPQHSNNLLQQLRRYLINIHLVCGHQLERWL